MRSKRLPLFLQLRVPYPLPSFPHATSQTLLAKFKQQHEDNRYFLGTPVMEPAFIIQHFAGKVKYQIKVRVCPLPSSVKGRRQERDRADAPEALYLWRLPRPSPLLMARGKVSGALEPSPKCLALAVEGPRGQDLASVVEERPIPPAALPGLAPRTLAVTGE